MMSVFFLIALAMGTAPPAQAVSISLRVPAEASYGAPVKAEVELVNSSDEPVRVYDVPEFVKTQQFHSEPAPAPRQPSTQRASTEEEALANVVQLRVDIELAATARPNYPAWAGSQRVGIIEIAPGKGQKLEIVVPPSYLASGRSAVSIVALKRGQEIGRSTRRHLTVGPPASTRPSIDQ